jgi:IS30 family transposase
MAAHTRFSVATGVPVYFCDPRSPWQRSSNENTNGLLRQYFPKRSDLTPFSQHDLDAVAAELNDRPRQTLGWMTPSEALDKALR